MKKKKLNMTKNSKQRIENKHKKAKKTKILMKPKKPISQEIKNIFATKEAKYTIEHS